MDTLDDVVEGSGSFLRRSVIGVAVVSLLLVTPFAVNNLVQGRYLLAAGAAAILALLAYNGWCARYRNRLNSTLTLLTLVPSIVGFLLLSIAMQGIIGLLWCFPAAVAFYFILPERKALVANAMLLVGALPAAWWTVPPAQAARLTVTLLMVSALTAIAVRFIYQQQRRLERLVATDPLTGLLNRSTLETSLDRAVRQHRRSGPPMSLIGLDLDHFKRVNDSFGHAAGDEVLRALGRLLHQRCRSTDAVFRLGGEEFLVLLYGTDKTGAVVLAESLRAAIEVQPLLPDVEITASFGVATLRDGERWHEWLRRCDARLYAAKDAGRNRVEA